MDWVQSARRRAAQSFKDGIFPAGASGASSSSNTKLRTSLLLFFLLFLATWMYQHARVGKGAKYTARATSFVEGHDAVAAEVPAPATDAIEAVANVTSGPASGGVDGEEARNATAARLQHDYEELLDAVEHFGNVSLPLDLLARFRTIEEECWRPHTSLDLTGHVVGITAIAIFVLAYLTVIFEEKLSEGGAKYHKSISMTIAAGLIWILIAFEYRIKAPHMLDEVESAFRTSFLEFGETFLFLVVAMTYVETLSAMNVFKCVKCLLVDMRFSLKQLFWVTGLLSFLLSPLADNLTTALLMGAVIRSVGSSHDDFMTLSLVNIVVASNAGGAFSPFGDITTLMIWQKGKLGMRDFPHIIVPSLVNWLIPAFFLQRALPEGKPTPSSERSRLSVHAVLVVMLFFLTIATTALAHAWLKLPAVLGMMTGLGFLQLYGYALSRVQSTRVRAGRGGKQWHLTQSRERVVVSVGDAQDSAYGPSWHEEEESLFNLLAKIDWDTLLFFYGVIVSVGGLGVMGYLSALANFAFNELGPVSAPPPLPLSPPPRPTPIRHFADSLPSSLFLHSPTPFWTEQKPANILVGGLSALIDNIPVLYSVLVANPSMARADWMLVTLTSGCGGSILSFGSAAGVGLSGQEPKHYNFHSHLNWSWAIIFGYVGSIIAHFILNGF